MYEYSSKTDNVEKRVRRGRGGERYPGSHEIEYISQQ
jgi:hypothetical protein